MSTDRTTPADPSQDVPSQEAPSQEALDQPGATRAVPEDGSAAHPGQDEVTDEDEDQDEAHGRGQGQEPGFVSRHTTSLITVLVAVIVAALAIGGLAWYQQQADDANADTEAAFVAVVSGQGATVETVECDGDTCAAVIAGQAYTVLVQEDEAGEQHFGVGAYVGD